MIGSLKRKLYKKLRRKYIVAQALETDEGRAALAQSMVEPIRRSLEYQSIGRKLLMVDELPEGALARYECKEPNVGTYKSLGI